jgi:hypothetical protein
MKGSAKIKQASNADMNSINKSLLFPIELKV